MRPAGGPILDNPHTAAGPADSGRGPEPGPAAVAAAAAIRGTGRGGRCGEGAGGRADARHAVGSTAEISMAGEVAGRVAEELGF